MTGRRLTQCAVCGRRCVGTRCVVCVRAGLDAPHLWCRCDEPTPEPVLIADAVTVPGAVQCARCGRPIEGGH